jgi:hypothetical protein
VLLPTHAPLLVLGMVGPLVLAFLSKHPELFYYHKQLMPLHPLHHFTALPSSATREFPRTQRTSWQARQKDTKTWRQIYFGFDTKMHYILYPIIFTTLIAR